MSINCTFCPYCFLYLPDYLYFYLHKNQNKKLQSSCFLGFLCKIRHKIIIFQSKQKLFSNSPLYNQNQLILFIYNCRFQAPMQPSFIKKPIKPIQATSTFHNIFSKDIQNQEQTLDMFVKQQNNAYHYIGSQDLRDKIMAEHLKESKILHPSTESKQSLIDLSKSITITIKRQTNDSKVSSLRKEINRDLKSINHYKEYQDIWKKQNNRIKNCAHKGNSKNPTLLETNIKKLQVIPNPEKEEIMSKYLSNYWEMSLRNHSTALTSFMKGDIRYDQDEILKKLNLDQSKKQMERSLPRLPLQKLKNINEKQFVISGRSKLGSQTGNYDPSVLSNYTSSRLSMASLSKNSLKQKEDVYKLNYDISHGYTRKQTNKE